MEVWRDVVEYEGVYQVSNFGRVKRIKRARGAKFGGILSQHTDPKSLEKKVVLSKDSKPKVHRVHRLVAFAFLGSPPTERHVVAHGDGNASNNRLANLRWATRSENSFDQVLHGTNVGKYHGRKSALSDEQVTAILLDKRSHEEVAKDFNLSPGTVGQIRRRETHKHVPDVEDGYKSPVRNIRFTDDQVRSLRNDPRGTAELARAFDCSPTTIWTVRTKRSYAHVPDVPPVEDPVIEEVVDIGPKNKIKVVGDIAMIELSSGDVAIIDADKIDVISDIKWYRLPGDRTNYAVSNKRLEDRTVVMLYLHRVLTDCPDDMVVDHINGDGLDNRMCNLRVVTVAENNLNSRVRSDSQTGIKGAYYDKRKGSYYSRITINGKDIYLGTFKTAKEAAEAYAEASRKYHGKYGRTHLDD